MTREEAILCIKGMKNYARDTFTKQTQTDWQTSLDKAIEALEQGPKTGHWSREWYINRYEEICSVCGCGEDFKTDYCPNCGAKMRVD